MTAAKTIEATWCILDPFTLSGEDNMRYDAETLSEMERGARPPTLRFFRFSKPTVSYGRLQQYPLIQSLIPSGWDAVQRPTGGGLVFHQDDLCLSLCWPKGQAPLPQRPQDQYRWIHGIILEALGAGFRMSACCDAKPLTAPFETRECFTNPVGYDLIEGDQKIVGGALSCHRGATLYQGAIHLPWTAAAQSKLLAAFETRLRDL